MEKRKNYYSMDTMKAIGAFFVVCLHVPMFKGTNLESLGEYIIAVSRIGVPFFFMVSGFFGYRADKPTPEKNKRSLGKIGKHILVMLGVDAVYAVYNITLGGWTVDKLLSLLAHPNFYIANFHIASHMWFMRALIYLEIVSLIFVNLPFRKIASKIGVVLLAGVWIYDLIFVKYSVIIGIPTLNGSSREAVAKFVSTGFLYFFLGWIFRKHNEKITKWCEGKKVLLAIIFSFSVVMTIVECDFLISKNANVSPVNFFFTIVSVLTLFAMLITFSNFGKGSKTCFVGGKLSMYIYYWHLLVRNILVLIFKSAGWSPDFVKNPVTVFFATLLVSLIIYFVKNGLDKKKKKKLVKTH